MKIGVPREIKTGETRVAMTPGCVQEICHLGHQVIVEQGAGLDSGYPDRDYRAVGAQIGTVDNCWACELVVKVKEPQPDEYGYFRPDQMLFAFLHLAASPDLEAAILDSGMTAIAYEMVALDDGTLPILTPMSEIAGRIGALMAANLLLKPSGGPGILPGGLSGVERARFTIIGAGHAGQAALQYAIGMNADVTILDIDLKKLKMLEERFHARIHTLYSNQQNLSAAIRLSDAVISTVLVPGAHAPCLVTRDMVRSMQPGRVIVDIAIDQGGSVETIDKATTHDRPTYTRHDILHYAVANIPAAAPCTATAALSNATQPYIRLLANHGLEALKTSKALSRGLVSR